MKEDLMLQMGMGDQKVTGHSDRCKAGSSDQVQLLLLGGSTHIRPGYLDISTKISRYFNQNINHINKLDNSKLGSTQQ